MAYAPSIPTASRPPATQQTNRSLPPSLTRPHPRTPQLLRYNPMAITQRGVPGYGAGSGAPHVMLAFLKHLWTQGQRTEAFNRIQDLVGWVDPGLGKGVGGRCVSTVHSLVTRAAAAVFRTSGGKVPPQLALGQCLVPPILPHAYHELRVHKLMPPPGPGPAPPQVRELQANAVPPAAAAAAATAAAAAAANGTNRGATAAATAVAAASAPSAAPGGGGGAGSARWLDRPQASLNGRAFLRLGIWQWAMNDVSAASGALCAAGPSSPWRACSCRCPTPNRHPATLPLVLQDDLLYPAADRSPLPHTHWLALRP